MKSGNLFPSELAAAVRALDSGGVVAFPTDTFFALGVDALNPSAILKAFEIKRRREGVPMPVLISDISQMTDLVDEFPSDAKELALRHWPGALTIVLPASGKVPRELNGGSGTVGVRIPENDDALKLINKFGSGLTGTSANKSGQPPTKIAQELRASIGHEIDVILNGSCGTETAPSTVIDMTGDQPKIVRQGAVSVEQLGISDCM